MKFLNNYIAFFLMLIALLSYGQKSKKALTGTLEFSIDYEGNWDPVSLANAPRFFTVNVGENHLKTIYNIQGIVLETIVNVLDSTMTILISAMGDKIYAKIPKFAILEKLDEKSLPKIEYTEESKTIANFIAYKAIYSVKNEFGEDEQFEVWFTKEIGKPSMNFGQQFHGLDGFPIQYTLQVEQGNVIYQLKSFNNKKFKTLDFMIPTDYREVDYKQLQEMLGM